MPIPQDRDIEALSRNLENWLSAKDDMDAVKVLDLKIPENSGFSNETLMADISCEKDGKPTEQKLVVRMKPTNYEVFPEYDMAIQYKSMQKVKEHSDVPVPDILHTEDTGEILGQPFFVMNFIEGKVPSDNPPYFAGGDFVMAATDQQRKTLFESSLRELEKIHAIDWEKTGFQDFLDQPQFGPIGFNQQLAYYRNYLELAAEGRPQPTVDRALEYFEKNNPTADMPEQLSWGDSRPNNIMYGEDFKPVAVLDWEMASIGPAEVDLAWFMVLSRFLCRASDAEWPPGFLDREETIAYYEKLCGRKMEHMDYFDAWAIFRFCVIMIRIVAMQIKYGEMPKEARAYETNNPATHMLAEFLGYDPPS